MRDSKLQVLRSLKKFTPTTLAQNIVRGAEQPQARIDDELVSLDEGRFAVSWPPAERANAGLLRSDDGLGAMLCRTAMERPTPRGLLRLRYGEMRTQLADVREWLGQGGQLRAALVDQEQQPQTTPHDPKNLAQQGAFGTAFYRLVVSHDDSCMCETTSGLALVFRLRLFTALLRGASKALIERALR